MEDHCIGCKLPLSDPSSCKSCAYEEEKRSQLNPKEEPKDKYGNPKY